MAENGHLTPTERRLIGILMDGQPHAVRQLVDALNEDAHLDIPSGKANLQNHIARLRKKYFAPRGLEVVCQLVLHRENYRVMRSIGRDDE